MVTLGFEEVRLKNINGTFNSVFGPGNTHRPAADMDVRLVRYHSTSEGSGGD